MEKRVVELDVREDIRCKIKPFNKIMNAIEDLQGNDIFILHAPFKPSPLLEVMKGKGFMYEIEVVEFRHWKITFTKKGIADSSYEE